MTERWPKHEYVKRDGIAILDQEVWYFENGYGASVVKEMGQKYREIAPLIWTLNPQTLAFDHELCDDLDWPQGCPRLPEGQIRKYLNLIENLKPYVPSKKK